MVSGTGLLAVIGSAGLVAAVVGEVIGGAVVAGGRRLGLLRLGWCVIGDRKMISRIAGVRVAVSLRRLAAVYRVLFIVALASFAPFLLTGVNALGRVNTNSAVFSSSLLA